MDLKISGGQTDLFLSHFFQEGDMTLSQNIYFNFNEYKEGLLFRIAVFAFMGIGWDILMTILQQIISGKITLSILCPASGWMYLAYGSVPLFFYPIDRVGRFFRSPFGLRVLIFMLIFYIFEYCFGATLRHFGATPWDYNWYLDPKWTLHGLITWHPAFLAAWAVFVILGGSLDSTLRTSYPEIRRQWIQYWEKI